MLPGCQYYCKITVVRVYVVREKCQKKLKVKKQYTFFVIFLLLVAIQLEEVWGPSPPPLATPIGGQVNPKR